MTDPTNHASTQLPACDDCRKRKIRCDRRVPQCSNCQRSRVPCVFTNEGKKYNTTRQLVDDVAGLNSRLSAIDDTNAKLLQRIDALSAEISRSRQHTPRPNTTPKAAFQLPKGSGSPRTPEQVSKSGHTARGSGTSFVIDEGGGEQFYGAISTLALLRHARDEVENFVQNIQHTHPQTSAPSYPSTSHGASPTSVTSSNLQFELQRRVEAIDQKLAQTALNLDRYEHLGDDPGLSLPPRELLDRSIEGFFEKSNVERLIFHKQIVLDAVEQHYQPNTSNRDEAWVLSFNNIVLLSLSGRSKTVRDGQYVLSDIDYDLLDSRVEAATRVFHRIDQFSRPRLLSVQALLTLVSIFFVGITVTGAFTQTCLRLTGTKSLVARRFFTFQVFERIFLLACQMAKHMGLQEGLYSQDMSQTMQEERTNVLWALYAIDKQRVVVKDVPCQLYLFELNVDFPIDSQGSSSSRQDPIAGQLRLTIFLEELYKQLHSPQARRQDSSQRQIAVVSLNQQLDAWWENHQSLLTECDADGCLTVASLHLRYFFLSTKVVIHHASDPEDCQATCVKYSTEALRIIQLLCAGHNLLDGGLETLSRLFRGCSVMPYYVLFDHVLKNRQSREYSDQLGLLAACTKALGQVILPKFSESYFVRMHFGMTWCTDALMLIRQAERASVSVPGAFEAPAPVPPFPQSGQPYQQMSLPQYHALYPTEGYLSAALQSNLAPGPMSDPSAFASFGGSASASPSSQRGYSDVSRNMGSSSSSAPSTGKYRPANPVNAPETSTLSSAAPGMQAPSGETFAPMSQQQGQAPSAGVFALNPAFSMNPALFQNLFGSNPNFEDQQRF